MNKVILVGRLGKDPEVRSTEGGTHIASFSVATDDGYGDNKKTNWHNIVAFGKTADSVSSYLSKGSLAAIVGFIQYRSWDKKDGTKAYVTEVIADRVEFLSTNSGERHDKSAEYNQDTQSDDDDSIPF